MCNVDRFSVAKEFHLKEYEFLKEEIADLVDHMRKIEVYAVGATAAFYAWFIKTHPTTFALAIPIALAVLGGFRSYAVLLRVYEIAKYIRHIEKNFALNDASLSGWDSYLQQFRNSMFTRLSIYIAPFFSSAALFWVLFISSTSLLFYISTPPLPISSIQQLIFPAMNPTTSIESPNNPAKPCQ